MTPEPRIAELAWYRKHGKYPERITSDSKGLQYVIGDWAWHRKYPRKSEFIEERMRHECIYEVTP